MIQLCREQKVALGHLPPGTLAVHAKLLVITTITYAGRTRQISWAEETVQLKDYGDARQITLFEHGRVALQILTSDCDACPAEILSWLKSRWREENFLKYASENYGIDKICDYLATIETNAKLIRNPARDQANAAVRDAEKTLAAAERGLAVLLGDPGLSPAAKNDRIPGLQQNIPAPAPRWPPPSRPASQCQRNCPPAASTRRENRAAAACRRAAAAGPGLCRCGRADRAHRGIEGGGVAVGHRQPGSADR